MKFVAEYIWLDGKNNLRAKSRTVNISVTQQELQKRDIMKEILDVSLYKDWSYDGSSTWQAVGSDSEMPLCCSDDWRSDVHQKLRFQGQVYRHQKPLLNL